MKKMICFDMDGTIADLYGVENWLEKLRASDASPYIEARPLWDMDALRSVLDLLMLNGWEIRIVSWLSKGSDKAYDKAVREAKREWLTANGFPFDRAHFVAYGATKANSVRGAADYAVLVDDNDKVRNGWKLGATINPTACDLIEELAKLLGE